MYREYVSDITKMMSARIESEKTIHDLAENRSSFYFEKSSAEESIKAWEDLSNYLISSKKELCQLFDILMKYKDFIRSLKPGENPIYSFLEKIDYDDKAPHKTLYSNVIMCMILGTYVGVDYPEYLDLCITLIDDEAKFIKKAYYMSEKDMNEFYAKFRQYYNGKAINRTFYDDKFNPVDKVLNIMHAYLVQCIREREQLLAALNSKVDVFEKLESATDYDATLDENMDILDDDSSISDHVMKELYSSIMMAAILQAAC